jgi:hypothetical protein
LTRGRKSVKIPAGVKLIYKNTRRDFIETYTVFGRRPGWGKTKFVLTDANFSQAVKAALKLEKNGYTEIGFELKDHSKSNQVLPIRLLTSR